MINLTDSLLSLQLAPHCTDHQAMLTHHNLQPSTKASLGLINWPNKSLFFFSLSLSVWTFLRGLSSSSLWLNCRQKAVAAGKTISWQDFKISRICPLRTYVDQFLKACLSVMQLIYILIFIIAIVIVDISLQSNLKRACVTCESI